MPSTAHRLGVDGAYMPIRTNAGGTMMSALTPVSIDTRIRFPARRVNWSAISAGTTVLLIYLFAGLPIQIGVLTQLGLSAGEASSWFFITWLTTGLFSLVLALLTGQPVSINLSIPALIFLAGAAGGFSLPEILGANLVVGLVAIGLSSLRLTDAFARLVPSQIAIGVFAGSMLASISKTSHLAVTDLAASGPVIAGFLLALVVTRSQLVAVGAAAASGLLAIALAGGMPSAGHSAALPQISMPAMDFDPSALVALGIPLLVLTVGVGNIQTLAVLRSESYRVRGNLFGLAAGIATVVNALGGGHAAAIGGTSTAVAAGRAAGPSGSRFWSIVLSSLPVVAIALAAVPVIAFVQDLPVAYTLSVGALALAAPLRQVLPKTLAGPMRSGALTALIVAALPLQVAGMPMAFWALVAGVVVSAVVDHGRIARLWRPSKALPEAA